MADNSSNSMSTTMTRLFMQERSVLRILKKTTHLRRLRKILKKEMKKIAPRLASHMPQLAGDFEHDIVTVDFFITKLRCTLRIDNPLSETGKKVWRELWNLLVKKERKTTMSQRMKNFQQKKRN
ncbi:hypothetical protein OROMI_014519 [Orobanche minor]